MSEDQFDLEIDLRFLLSWWREIAVFTVLCVTVAYGVTRVLPRTYEAQSQVLLLRSRANVNLESGVEIETEGDTLTSAGPGTATYSDLVANPVVAEDVLDRLDVAWVNESTDAASLLGGVEAETTSNSDLLLIKFRDPDPARAAAVATAWGEAYVTYVNQLYNEASADYDAVVTQLSLGQTEYQAAQVALEAFVAEEQIAELQRLAQEKTALIDRLQADKEVALTVLSDTPTSTSVISAYADAVVSNRIFSIAQPACEPVVSASSEYTIEVVSPICSATLSLGLEERLADLDADYRRLEQYRRQLSDVALLRDQLEQGGDPASGVLAIALLKAQLLDVDRGLPAELSFQLQADASVDRAVQQADLDALETVLEAGIGDLEASIADQTSALSQISYGLETLTEVADPVDVRLTDLQAEVQILWSEIERQSAAKQELKLARDLALESYTTLARKEAELRIANELPASDVRFAAPATVPGQPVSPRTMLIVGGTAAAGLTLAVVGAFLMNYLGHKPILGRRGKQFSS